jgi:hypothetical protein
MSETRPESASPALRPDRYKLLVVLLTVVTTVLTATVAALQADTNIRASDSNRDSQLNAILVSGELHRQGLQSSYDINVFTNILEDSQAATVMELTAAQLTQAGNSQPAADSQLKAAVDQARADAATRFSIFYTDPRYAPKSAGEPPNMQAYLTDSYVPSKDLLAKQNAASDQYHRWDNKGGDYTSILAVLAIAFFLFGLAQALSPRLRLLFALFGLAALIISGIWTLIVVLS